MAENSKIEWTRHTFNLWEGCQKVGPKWGNFAATRDDALFYGAKEIIERFGRRATGPEGKRIIEWARSFT